VYRDGHPPHEAVALARVRLGATSEDALRELLAQLPVRPRRRMVPEDAVSSSAGEWADPTVSQEARDVRRAVASGLRALSPQDRWLVCMRYGQGHSVPALAQTLGVDAKGLYGRFDRLLATLRQAVADRE
jgi:DNA-directed RNA polymerase specialized sigma24 family protein